MATSSARSSRAPVTIEIKLQPHSLWWFFSSFGLWPCSRQLPLRPSLQQQQLRPPAETNCCQSFFLSSRLRQKLAWCQSQLGNFQDLRWRRSWRDIWFLGEAKFGQLWNRPLGCPSNLPFLAPMKRRTTPLLLPHPSCPPLSKHFRNSSFPPTTRRFQDSEHSPRFVFGKRNAGILLQGSACPGLLSIRIELAPHTSPNRIDALGRWNVSARDLAVSPTATGHPAKTGSPRPTDHPSTNPTSASILPNCNASLRPQLPPGSKYRDAAMVHDCLGNILTPSSRCSHAAKVSPRRDLPIWLDLFSALANSTVNKSPPLESSGKDKLSGRLDTAKINIKVSFHWNFHKSDDQVNFDKSCLGHGI